MGLQGSKPTTTEDPQIEAPQPKKASQPSDVFLSHDWGVGGATHRRVGMVNAALQKRGLKTRFDETISGKAEIVTDVDNTQCVIVFITQSYVEKVVESGEFESNKFI